jgi:transposase
VGEIAQIEEKEPETPIYYVDEMGIDKYLHREKGRAPRGVKIYAEIKGKKFKRTSVVAAKCGNSIVAPLMFDGTMDGKFFEFWFETCLCKEVEKGAVVIMDNAAIHKKTVLFELAKKAGIRLIFQPAYSPDLNKIEHFWAWLKNELRKILPNYAKLEDAICAAFQIYKEKFYANIKV